MILQPLGLDLGYLSGHEMEHKMNLRQKVSNLQNLILAEAGAQFLMFRCVEKHRKIGAETIVE